MLRNERPAAEPYWQRIKRLRLERGLSQPAFFRLVDGVSFEMLRAIERPAGSETSRYPSPATLHRVAAALAIEPEEFPEYRLARARDALDERITGLDAALANLDAFPAQQGDA